MPEAGHGGSVEIERARSLVWDLWAPLVEPDGGGWADVDLAMFDDNTDFFGPAPVGLLQGVDSYTRDWIAPLAQAFPHAKRQPYLFLAGSWADQIWVATTGNIVGDFERDFLGVPATGRCAELRFGEFYRVVDGRVAEVRCLIDLLALAAEAGYPLLPPFPASADLPAGPALAHGVLRGPQDPDESAATLQLVEDMLGGCNRLVDGELTSMGMDAYWHQDMRWAGPWGVGTTFGFHEFQQWAQGPSVASFPNRRGGFHQARFADGPAACFTGWPSLQGTFDGEPFRGIAPTGQPIGQNIMDFYIRRDDLLHENWVLIDLIDFAAQCGVDLLAQLPKGSQ